MTIKLTEVATTIQPSECQNNPAYIHLGPMENSQAAALVTDDCNQNPAYNIEAPIYEVIRLDADESSHTVLFQEYAVLIIVAKILHIPVFLWV